MDVHAEAVDAATIRAEIARVNVRMYRVAAMAGIHPTRLSGMLHGRIPLSAAVAERVMRELATLKGEQGA